MELRDQLQSALGSAYTIERELAGGGMARVFVATENRLHRSVVVKVLSPELALGVSAGRFEREIQVVAQLQQANIVPLLSAGETNGLPYFTMPFVEGESLRARMAKTGALPAAESVGILRDIARALGYAHAHGVVHRDIKPENVLLSHGTAVVSDFGIAKALSASRTSAGDASFTQTGTSIGTPTYMSPEQAAGDPDVDHRADIYAFGCVAYELLGGRPPFVGPTPQRVIAAHLSEKPRPVGKLRPGVPAGLAALIMRCLEKSPADRPTTADEIVQALDTIAAPSGVNLSPRPGPLARMDTRTRRTMTGVVVVLTVALVGASIWRAARSRAGGADKSIAVLPLANLSGDRANDYFGEGLAEEMTGALSKAGLRVIGRGSARALAAKGLDAQAIARQLGVGTVLQGTVQRADQQVRITVSLTSASDGSVLWSEKYDRQLKDVFAVQDEIARSVANELRVTMIGGAARTLVLNETSDPEAHALYLQGLYLWNRRTPTTLRTAVQLFEQAVARDPKYARALGGIALAYVVLAVYDDVSPDEMIAKARSAAQRALAIDSTLVEAYTALGYADATQWRNGDAERSFARAIELDSTFATAHFWRALLLQHIGRLDDALRELARARSLEPASLIINLNPALMMVVARRYREADSVARHVLALDGGFVLASYMLGRALVELNQEDSAIAIFKRLAEGRTLRASEIAGMLAYAYVRARHPDSARAVLAHQQTPGSALLPASGAIAAALDALGDRERALAVLQRAVDQHDPWLMLMGRAAALDGLRADPRAAPLFAKMETP